MFTVAQYDSQISVKISHATKTGSIAKRTIALLTLGLLSPTSICVVFGMDSVRQDLAMFCSRSPVDIGRLCSKLVLTNVLPDRPIRQNAVAESSIIWWGLSSSRMPSRGFPVFGRIMAAGNPSDL